MSRDFPKKFVKRVREMLPADQVDAFWERCTEPLPKTLRVRGGVTLPDSWKLLPVAGLPEAFFVDREDRTTALGRTIDHFSGNVYIATLSSLLAAKVLAPQPGEKVLDVCAAPGSKTTFLADQMEHSGVLIANELSASRSKKLAANIDRLGCHSVVLTQIDGGYMDTFFDQEFDKILLDAPCSSEGAGRKKSDFFEKMWSEQKIFEAAQLQRKLLISSFSMLIPGGEMLYSTCTTAPEENEAVVQHLLDKFGDAVEILPIDLNDVPSTSGLSSFFEQKFDPAISKNSRRLWPHLHSETWDSECFFLCRIRKTHGISRSPAKKARTAAGLRILSKNQSAEIIVRLCKNFGIPRSAFEDVALLDHGGSIFWTTRDAAQFAIKNAHRRTGLPLLDEHGNPTNPFAQIFAILATTRVVDLSPTDTEKFLTGLDLPLTERVDLPDGTAVLVRSDDTGLGWGKILQKGRKLKNRLDRSQVF